jgi:methionyl-tRNA formyltransferase
MRVGIVGAGAFPCAVITRIAEDDVAELGPVWANDAKLESHAVEFGLPVESSFFGLDDGMDVLLSLANYRYLEPEVVGSPRHGTWGYHPSLLPRHRGGDSVWWTVHMRDPIAGGTVYLLDGGPADSGPIIRQDWCHVDPTWTASDLWRNRLFSMGVELVVDSLAYLRDTGMQRYAKQDERVATWEPTRDRKPLSST